MTKRELNNHKKEILETVQISHAPTPKSITALAFSGAISTFGVYSIIDGAVTGDSLYYALGVFILILIVADTFKRGALSKFYNSKIRKDITLKGKVLNLQLVIFFLALSFMVMFDFIGSFSTANFIEQKYQDYRATSSKEYSLLQDNADNAKSALTLYSQELTIWQSDKVQASTNCDDEFKGWKAKYKAKCKKEWETKNPKPTNQNSSTSVKVEDYKEMKEGANDDFLSKNIYGIVLFLSMALTLLLQYTTISEIQDERDEIEEMLTPQLVGTLSDRLTILETNAVEHEAQRNELIRTADQAHKTEERKFEELGEGMKVLSLQKATVARGETLKRVANNEYVPIEAKAGMVNNPFYSDEPKKYDIQKYVQMALENVKRYKEEERAIINTHVFFIGLKYSNDFWTHKFTGNHNEDLKRYMVRLDGQKDEHGQQLYFQVISQEKATGQEVYYCVAYQVNEQTYSTVDKTLLVDISKIKEEVDEPTDYHSPTDEEGIFERLFLKTKNKNSDDMKGANEKLNPKTKVINASKRAESEALSRVYKKMVERGIAELRGNKGYYSLMGYSDASRAFHGNKVIANDFDLGDY